MVKLIDGKDSVVVYNVIIHWFVKCGMCDKALWFYDRMVRDRVKGDVVTYNVLMNGYFRDSRMEMALEGFKGMRGKGCSPNVVNFNTLIRGLFREWKFDDGIEMAHEMIEFGCEFSSVTCEILVDGLCGEGRVEKACEVLVDFSRRRVVPRGYDYYELVEVVCREVGAVRALEVVDEIWRNGNVSSVIACTTLVESLRREGIVDEALGVMGMMVGKEGMVPDIVTFNCLIQDLCDLGRTEKADKLRLLSSSKGLELDATTYDILVSGYVREGKQEEGKVLADEMLDRVFIPDLATYNRLVGG